MPLDWTNLKAIFELFSRRKSLLYFFPGAFNIKLVNSFILVWHSDYELSSKTHKPFFIIKESSKYHNIDYRAKNHVVLFCLVCSRSRASSTRTRPTSTHIGWRVEENFPETFKSQSGKNKNVIHRPRSVRITALGGTQHLGHSFSQYGPPSRWITYIYYSYWHIL